MQMTLASQGRSASALTGALSGSGTVTLESAEVAGLDPRAFEAAIRASDGGQATDDVKLRQIVERVLVGRRRCRSSRRRFRSASATAGSASARPRSMPKARAPSYRADTIFPPTRPTSAPASLRRRWGRRAAARRFSCSPRVHPTRSIAPSMWRRCRHGWRCGRSTAKPDGSMRSSAASRRRRFQPRCRRRPRRRRGRRTRCCRACQLPRCRFPAAIRAGRRLRRRPRPPFRVHRPHCRRRQLPCCSACCHGSRRASSRRAGREPAGGAAAAPDRGQAGARSCASAARPPRLPPAKLPPPLVLTPQVAAPQ